MTFEPTRPAGPTEPVLRHGDMTQDNCTDNTRTCRPPLGAELGLALTTWVGGLLVSRSRYEQDERWRKD